MEVIAPSPPSTRLSNGITADIRKKDGTTDTKENLWYVWLGSKDFALGPFDFDENTEQNKGKEKCKRNKERALCSESE